MFLNRTRELGYLSERYAAGRAEIVVLYGRRRVGKSALLFEWSEGKPCIFFFARRADKATLLGEFSRAIRSLRTKGSGAPEVPGGTPDDFTYPSWGAAFDSIAELAAERRLVVILDEFPYLVEADHELPTLLQREWDLRLQHTQIFLVLSGSIQSVIQQQVLDPTAPLYRRHTWPFELKPLTLADLPAFFPRYTVEQLVETFAILGGMPYYLISVDPQVGLLTNIKRHILAPQGSLFAEVRLQLHEELRGDIEESLAILRAIAGGAHRRADIARHLDCLLERPITAWRPWSSWAFWNTDVPSNVFAMPTAGARITCAIRSSASGTSGCCLTKTTWPSAGAKMKWATRSARRCPALWPPSGRRLRAITCWLRRPIGSSRSTSRRLAPGGAGMRRSTWLA